MADNFNGQLAQVRVGIAGLGGLGSHIAVFLARAGVKHLHLVDFDRAGATIRLMSLPMWNRCLCVPN